MKRIFKSTKFRVALAIAIGLATSIYGIRSLLQRDLSNRLTASIQESVHYPGIFDKSKLISSHQDLVFNLNGDSAMNGTFQLSEKETLKLLASDPPLRCSVGTQCDIQKNNYNPSAPQGSFCSTRDKPGGVLSILCIDTRNNQAHWSVTWY